MAADRFTDCVRRKEISNMFEDIAAAMVGYRPGTPNRLSQALIYK